MITRESLEQLFDVLKSFRSYYKTGNTLTVSRQQAVKNVAIKYRVTYQTIGDACRRRLGLETTDDFNTLLKNWMNGFPTELKKIFKSVTNNSQHSTIDEFFNKYDNTVKGSSYGEMETKISEQFIIHLPPNKARLLRAYAELEGNTVSEVVQNTVIPIARKKMREMLNKI